MFKKNKSNNSFSNKKFNSASGSTADLKRRLIFLLLALLVFRIGAHVPVPGLDPTKLQELFASGKGGIFGLFNLFSGGSLARLSIFSLGIMPYISGSIIVQLLTLVTPSLGELKKEGYSGKKKLSKYTKFLTLFLATFQSIGMAKFMAANSINVDFSYYFTVCITLVAGTMFLMWLGEQITEKGIGNGVSLLIFSGIVVNLPNAIANTLERVRQGDLHLLGLILLLIMFIGVIAVVVFFERGLRLINITYVRKKQIMHKTYMLKNHLPFKINSAGVMPPIFASSIILFPATISQWFGASFENLKFLSNLTAMLSPGKPLYICLFGVAIVFFTFFYTALVFNPKETDQYLQKEGAVISGLRPGDQTIAYIDDIMSKLTLIGAIYITVVSLLPEFLVMFLNVPFYFGGTSLLIIVVVVIEFMEQIETYLAPTQYHNFLMGRSKVKIV